MLKVVAPERLTAVMRTATYSWSGRSGVVLMVKTLVSWTPRLFQLLILSPTLTSMEELSPAWQPPSTAAAPRAAAEAPVTLRKVRREILFDIKLASLINGRNLFLR